MRTHYDNLRVKQNAEPEVIRAAYRALAQKWHPDRNPDNKEQAEKYFKIISRAYEVLSHPELRSKYDEELLDARMAFKEQQKKTSTKNNSKAEPKIELPKQKRRNPVGMGPVLMSYVLWPIFISAFIIFFPYLVSWYKNEPLTPWLFEPTTPTSVKAVILTTILLVSLIAGLGYRRSVKESGMPTSPDKSMASRY